jgi:hypothetical protein
MTKEKIIEIMNMFVQQTRFKDDWYIRAVDIPDIAQKIVESNTDNQLPIVIAPEEYFNDENELFI